MWKLWLQRGKYDYFRTTVSERVGEVEIPEAEYVTYRVCDGVSTEEYEQGL